MLLCFLLLERLIFIFFYAIVPDNVIFSQGFAALVRFHLDVVPLMQNLLILHKKYFRIAHVTFVRMHDRNLAYVEENELPTIYCQSAEYYPFFCFQGVE